MRKLAFHDVFSALRLMMAMEQDGTVKSTVEKIVKTRKDSAEGETAETLEKLVGVDILFYIMERAADAGVERKVYEFLAGPFELTADEVEGMDLDTLQKNLAQLVKDNDVIGFFVSAWKNRPNQ
jgi:NMD protein affecting ribosome stability and mRNA decay